MRCKDILHLHLIVYFVRAPDSVIHTAATFSHLTPGVPRPHNVLYETVGIVLDRLPCPLIISGPYWESLLDAGKYSQVSLIRTYLILTSGLFKLMLSPCQCYVYFNAQNTNSNVSTDAPVKYNIPRRRTCSQKQGTSRGGTSDPEVWP